MWMYVQSSIRGASQKPWLLESSITTWHPLGYGILFVQRQRSSKCAIRLASQSLVHCVMTPSSTLGLEQRGLGGSVTMSNLLAKYDLEILDVQTATRDQIHLAGTRKRDNISTCLTSIPGIGSGNQMPYIIRTKDRKAVLD